MSCKKFLSSVFRAGAAVAALCAILSCSDNVGLGTSVDTEAPGIEILYPPASAAVRGTFVFAGKWSDDKGVSAIELTITNTTTKQTYPANDVTFSSDGTWSVSVNDYSTSNESYTNGWQLPDGKYELSVVAKDAAGHSSGASSRALEIDNTAPVVVLTNPGTTDITKATAYGSTFKVSGTVADEHTISELSIFIYDENGNRINAEPYTETNVPTAGGTSVTLLKFDGAGNGTSPANQRYTEVYGTDVNKGETVYQCSVSITDSAKLYGEEQYQAYLETNSTDNDSVGNTTNTFYLNSDIYEAFLSEKLGLGLSAADLMTILNGTYSGTKVARAATAESGDTVSSVLAALKNYAVDTTQKKLAFSLNPLVNPSYTVSGYALVKKEEGDTTYRSSTAVASQPITVIVNMGLDEVQVKPATFKAYIKDFGSTADLYDKDSGAVSEKVSAFVNMTASELEAHAADDNNGTRKFTADEYTGADLVDNYQWQLKLPDPITSGHWYVIAVAGADGDGNELRPTAVYGFEGTTSGIPPKVRINSLDKEAYGTTDISITGTATSSDGTIEKVTYTIRPYDVDAAKFDATATGTATYNNGTWSFNLKDKFASQEAGKNIQYAVTVEAKDSNNTSSEEQTVNILVDTKKPVIAFGDLSGLSDGATITNTSPNYTRSGTSPNYTYSYRTAGYVSDVNGAGIDKVFYSTNGTDWQENTDYADRKTKYTISLDIPVGQTSGDGKIWLKVTDKAGNESDIVKRENLTFDYDAPTLTVQTSLESYVANNPIAITGTLTDSLALPTASPYGVTITATKGGSAYTFGANEVTYTQTNDKTTDFTINIPAQNGNDAWVFTIKGTDKAGIESAVQTKTVTVDVKGPELTVKKPSDREDITLTADGKYTFTFSAPDEGSGLKDITYTLKKGNAVVGSENTSASGKGNSRTAEVNFKGTDYGEGTYTLSVTAKDNLGNATTNGDITFYYDSANPTLSETGVGATRKVTNSAFTLSGTASDTNALKSENPLTIVDSVTVGGTLQTKNYTPTVGSDGTWSLQLTPVTGTASGDNEVADGDHTYTITLTDVVGKTAQLTRTVQTDKTSPTWKTDNTDGEQPYLPTATYTSGTGTDAKNWYGTSTITVSAAATDATSGVAKLQYTLGRTAHDVGNSAFTITAAEGQNSIAVKAVDNAGNATGDTTLTAYVDTTAPSDLTLTGVSVGGTALSEADLANLTKPTDPTSLLVNKTGDVVFTVTATDSGSGIDWSKSVIQIGNTKLNNTYNADANQFTIPKDNLATGTVNLTLYDNVGNSAQFAVFTLEADATVPKAAFSYPATGATVNKTVTISGSASDNRELDKAILKISTDGKSADEAGKEWTTLATFVTGTAGTGETTLDTSGEWEYSLDTTVYTKTGNKLTAAAQTAMLRVEVTDKAGNTAHSDNSMTIDQKSDRPIVSITSISSAKTLSTATIYGTVEDDDGIPSAANFAVGERVVVDENGKFLDEITWKENSDSELTYNGGSWQYKPATKQGKHRLYFRIKDNAGAVFITEATVESDVSTTTNADAELTMPYIRLSDYDANATDRKQNQYVYVPYLMDTNPPTVESIYVVYGSKESETTEELKTNMKLSKAKNNGTFKLRVKATDTSGIGKIVVTLQDENGNNLIEKTEQVDDTKTTVNKDIEVSLPESDGACTFPTLAVTVVDKTGAETLRSTTVILDNEAPSIQSITPASGTEINGDIVVRGTTSDGNGAGVEKVAYFIPSTDETVTNTTDATNITKLNGLGWKELENSTISWNIDFTATETVDNRLTTNYFHGTLNSDDTMTYTNTPENSSVKYGTLASKSNSEASVWALPIYFKLTDSVGNVCYVTDYVLNVNPDGDRPKTEISYPATNSILGGMINVFGSAEDNEEVTAVYYQIQKAVYTPGTAQHSVDISTLGDYNANNTQGYQDVTDYPNTEHKSNDTYTNKATGTTSWRFTINSSDFIESDENKATAIRVRVWARDNNKKEDTTGVTGLKGSYSDWVYISLDSQIPKIDTPTLVQYSDNANGTGTVTASKTYTSGMWLSGKWWLTFSLTDENGINPNNTTLESPKINDASDSSLSITLGDGTSAGIDKADTSATHLNYPNAKVALDTTAMGSAGTGTINFTIYTEDNSEPMKSARQDIYLRFDNTPPEQTALKHNTVAVDASNNKITQSNYSYLFETDVKESGSGLARTVVYFYRAAKTGGTTSNRVYAPRFGTTTLVPITIDGNSVNIDDANNGLPYKTIEVSLAAGASTLTLSVSDASYITKGSLIKIGGVYRTVDAVSTNTITFSPALTAAAKTADLIYAFSVDNTKAESLNNATLASDDGDGIFDYVENQGSGNYALDFAIDSLKIPDGPLEVRYVSFDEAGNASDLAKVETFVENNAPRISRVILGTDLNGNGTIADDAANNVVETASYSTLKVVNGKTVAADAAEVDATSGANAFTAKAKTEVRPEIVGGNGAIYYGWKYQMKSGSEWDTETDGAAVDTTTPLIAENVTAYATGSTSTTTEALKNDRGDILQARTGTIKLDVTNDKLAGKITDGTARLIFTFWDSTEERTVGTDTLKATLTVDLNVDVSDDVIPKVVIDPFYWTSASDNSLYNNSRDNGHIELAADLPADPFKESTGEYDRDPKVSGIISVRGSAYDDQRLTALYMAIGAGGVAFTGSGDTLTADGVTYYKVATFDNGEWEGTDKLTENGWKFSAKTETLDQSGHSVTWQLDWNTAKINGMAGTDKDIRILAADGKTSPNKSATTAVEGDTQDKKNVPSYRVDVVPYITSIQRNTSGVQTFRSRWGRNPVVQGETITVTGFNFGTNASADTSKTSWQVGNGTETKVITTEANGKSTFTMTVPEKSGNLTVTTNGTKSLNNQNENDKAYNQEEDNYDGLTKYDERYLYVWNNGHTANGSSAISLMPSMDFDSTGTIYTTWAETGSSTIRLVRGIDKPKETIFVSYDQPTSYSAIGVDKSTNNMGVTFFPDQVGNGGKFSAWGLGSANIVGGAGFIAVNKDSKIELSGRNPMIYNDANKTARLNPIIKLDGNVDSDYYPIATHEFARNPGSFSAPQTARAGSVGHAVFHDETTGSLKYVAVPIETGQTEKYDAGRMFDVTVIDGAVAAYDRQHETAKGGNREGYQIGFEMKENKPVEENKLKTSGAAGWYKYDRPGIVWNEYDIAKLTDQTNEESIRQSAESEYQNDVEAAKTAYEKDVEAVKTDYETNKAIYTATEYWLCDSTHQEANVTNHSLGTDGTATENFRWSNYSTSRANFYIIFSSTVEAKHWATTNLEIRMQTGDNTSSLTNNRGCSSATLQPDGITVRYNISSGNPGNPITKIKLVRTAGVETEDSLIAAIEPSLEERLEAIESVDSRVAKKLADSNTSAVTPVSGFMFTEDKKYCVVTFDTDAEATYWKNMFTNSGSAAFAFFEGTGDIYNAFPVINATACEQISTLQRALKYTLAKTPAADEYGVCTLYGGHSTAVADGVGNATSAGDYAAIDVDKDGKPVILYRAGNKLRLAYAESATPTYTDWVRQETRLNGGLYVSMKIDSEGTLHAVYKDGTTLKYAKATFTGDEGYKFDDPVSIDSTGSLTMSTLSLYGTTPVVSYMNSESSEEGVKYAKPVTLVSGTVWDYQIVPPYAQNYVSANNYRVYVGANPGAWESGVTQGGVPMADCEAFVGYKTTRVEVEFLKKEQ